MKIQVKKLGLESENMQEVDLYTKEGFQLAEELWMKASAHQRLMYEPTWLGIPIVQYPTDMVMMQELLWKVRPDFVIETGIAHGGSCILHSSILELIGKGTVIGIDVEIRKYNETAIKNHPLYKRIKLIENSSIEDDTIQRVRELVPKGSKCVVALDSNHSYEHVKKEIELYKEFVGPSSYLVVMDGAQEWAADLPNGKPEWKEDNPLRAIREFIAENSEEWEIDEHYTRMKITSSPLGFLKRKDPTL